MDKDDKQAFVFVLETQIFVQSHKFFFKKKTLHVQCVSPRILVSPTKRVMLVSAWTELVGGGVLLIMDYDPHLHDP